MFSHVKKTSIFSSLESILGETHPQWWDTDSLQTEVKLNKQTFESSKACRMHPGMTFLSDVIISNVGIGDG